MSPINNSDDSIYNLEEVNLAQALRAEELLEQPILPPKDIWLRIEETMESDAGNTPIENKTGQRFIIGRVNWSALAAVVTLGVSCWVGWSNFQLQTQFVALLEQNQLLEQQLSKPGFTSYSEANLMQDLDSIESQLRDASSKQERLALLKLRRASIEKLIDIQNGKPKEFYL